MIPLIIVGLALNGAEGLTFRSTGRWRTNLVDRACEISSELESGGVKGTLTLRYKSDHSSAVSVAAPNLLFGNDRRVVGTIRDERSGATIQSDGMPAVIPSYLKGNSQFGIVGLTLYRVDNKFLSQIGPSISFLVDGKSATVTQLEIAAGWRSLSECNDGLLRKWGVNMNARSKLRSVALTVEPSATAWFRSSDYPSKANQRGQQGKSTLKILVSDLGKPTGCSVVETSGFDELDRRACEVILKRGRYSPALDVAGKPVPSEAIESIDWVLPS